MFAGGGQDPAGLTGREAAQCQVGRFGPNGRDARPAGGRRAG